jgi:hypothetical protein
MPTRSRKVPSDRLHKPTGQAVVRLDGRDHYLGRHGTPASREAYDRLVAEWLAAGRSLVATRGRTGGPPGVSIGELILAYWPNRVLTVEDELGYPGWDHDRPGNPTDLLAKRLDPPHQPDDLAAAPGP